MAPTTKATLKSMLFPGGTYFLRRFLLFLESDMVTHVSIGSEVLARPRALSSYLKEYSLEIENIIN